MGNRRIKPIITDADVKVISSETGMSEEVVRDVINIVPEFFRFHIEDNKDKQVVFSFKAFGQYKFVPRFLDRLTLKRNGRPRSNREWDGEVQSDSVFSSSVQEPTEEDI